MYKGIVAGGSTVTSAAVLTLPNTGSNMAVNLAVAVGIGLATWGVLYARSR